MGNPTRNKVCRLRETSLVYIFKCIDTKELTREPLLHLVKMKILICFSCSRVFLYADWTKEDLGSPAKRCVPQGICFEYSGPRHSKPLTEYRGENPPGQSSCADRAVKVVCLRFLYGGVAKLAKAGDCNSPIGGSSPPSTSNKSFVV